MRKLAAVFLAVTVLALLLGGCGRDREHSEINESIDAAEALEFCPSVEENEKGESVFQFNISDFIDSFNMLYRREQGGDYLRPLDGWARLIVHNSQTDCDEICYRFAYDKDIYTQPELSIFMAEGGGGIYRLVLSFDHHGYREAAFREYKDMCFCALSCFLPDMDREEIDGLFETLYANEVGTYPSENALQRLLCYKDTGFYTYLGGGTINIAIIPLNDGVKESFIENAYEIQGET